MDAAFEGFKDICAGVDQRGAFPYIAKGIIGAVVRFGIAVPGQVGQVCRKFISIHKTS